MPGSEIPRVRGNDWSSITPAAEHVATRSVSVVIPAYCAEATLPYTLAALEAQSYPDHLIEVVVVDDGGTHPITLPDRRPSNTRVVHSRQGWGRAHACLAGAAAAEGEVIHWLDADMVPDRHQVARQMRWHHALDHAVVLGHKMFVDFENFPSVAEVHAAVQGDTLEDLFADRWVEEHEWVERIWRRTGDLVDAGFRAFHVHVGATASVGRDFYLESGAMDPALKLGEDIELGYRLATKGAVFVAERGATSWHLGRSSLMRHEEQIQRYNKPFIAERVPDFRKFRLARGRSYQVSYVEVVVDTAGQTWDAVKHTVDGVLASGPGDITCKLLGDWSTLDEGRRHPLQDSLLEQRLIHEEYRSDSRVQLAESLDDTAFPAQFRLHLPVGWRPGSATLDMLTKDMMTRQHGLRSCLLPDGEVVRLERTAAFERALRVMRPGEYLDDVVDIISGSWWSDAEEDGFERLVVPRPSGNRRAGGAGPRATAVASVPGVVASPGLWRVLRRGKESGRG